MEFGLSGKKIAILVGSGVPERELEDPWTALQEAGADVHLLATKLGDVEVATPGSADGQRFTVTRLIDQAKPEEYVAMVVPGCVSKPHTLEENRAALHFVKAMMEADKPVAVIGSGIVVLAAAGVLEGRTVTGPGKLRDLVERAGAAFSDAAVQVDQRLVTSRSCDDLPSIGHKIVREFSNKLDSAKVDALSLGSFPASDPPPGPVAARAVAPEP